MDKRIDISMGLDFLCTGHGDCCLGMSTSLKQTDLSPLESSSISSITIIQVYATTSEHDDNKQRIFDFFSVSWIFISSNEDTKSSIFTSGEATSEFIYTIFKRTAHLAILASLPCVPLKHIYKCTNVNNIHHMK